MGVLTVDSSIGNVALRPRLVSLAGWDAGFLLLEQPGVIKQRLPHTTAEAHKIRIKLKSLAFTIGRLS